MSFKSSKFIVFGLWQYDKIRIKCHSAPTTVVYFCHCHFREDCLSRKTFQTPSLQKSTQKMMKLNLPPNVGFESGNFIQNLVDYLFQSFIGICFTTLLLFFLLCYLVSFCRTMDYFYRRWGTSESCTVRNDNAFCFSCVCISWCTTRLTSFLISLYLSH